MIKENQIFSKRYNYILNDTSFLQTVRLYFKSTKNEFKVGNKTIL